MRRAALALLAALSLGGAAESQPTAPGPTCTLYDVGGVAQAGPPLDRPARAERRGGAAATVRTEGRASTFEVTYAGFTAEAQAAFQAAVDVWADHVASPVPIRVDAAFEDLGPGVLGAAGPNITPDPLGAPIRNTYYPFALADALAGRDLAVGSPDIVATFNRTFDRFYFGPGEPPPGRFDFATVVLHELGHGLGFLGSGSADDGVASDGNARECEGKAGEGCWGYYPTATGTVDTGLPLVFDRFVEDRAGRALLDIAVYPNPSQTLGALLQGGDLFVDAAAVVAVNGGERAEVWAPSPFEVGSSFSHWDEVLFTAGTSAALMTPLLEPGEVYRDPGSATCAFFLEMGWALGPGCALLTNGGGVAAEAAPPDTALRLAGPNPLRARTAVDLRVPVAQIVRAVLVDVLGRSARTVHEGPVAAGVTRLDVDAAGLAAGVYVLVAETGAGVARLPLTVVR